MANVSAYAAKAMLDWLLGGATPTRPGTGQHALGLSFGTPSSTSGSECSVTGYSRRVMNLAAAASPAGSASNGGSVAFTVLSACTLVGWQLWDTQLASNSGNMLFQGLLSASSVMASADTLTFAIGAVKISLA